MGKMMSEGFDTGIKHPADTNNVEDHEPNIDLTPLEDVIIVEVPISEQEMSELLEEADALALQPFDEAEPLTDSFDPIQEVPIDYNMVFEGLDEYDFDGKDYNQNTEQLNSLLEGFTEDNWANIDLAGQKEQITGLFDYVNDVLGLENPPNIEYYNEHEQGNYGGYNPATNTLSINEYMLYDSNEAADTVAHELWHAYQHERASNPQSPKDYQYQFGFDNYIRPSDDFDGYQSQLVEAEARAFADQFKGALAQIKGA
ncbi:MAG: hypothetical protein LBQ69_06755 [Treponema sp.]|jgi:hypothetical protein|nr:hypothetical protein [Treponema sp.]